MGGQNGPSKVIFTNIAFIAQIVQSHRYEWFSFMNKIKFVYLDNWIAISTIPILANLSKIHMKNLFCFAKVWQEIKKNETLIQQV